MWTADKLIYRNEDDFIRAYQGSELVWEKSIPNNTIYYTSTDGQVINPVIGSEDEYGFGANIVSNTYSNGVGIIEFDGNVTHIGIRVFQDKITLSSIIIPYSVTKIGRIAFDGCENLSSIIIPDSVTELGSHIFSYCYSLSSIILPSNISVLPAGICLSCISLESVVIPDSVSSIENEVFMNCQNLSEVIINSIIPPVMIPSPYSGEYTQFFLTDDNMKIKVPTGSLQAYRTATGWSYYASDIIAQD